MKIKVYKNIHTKEEVDVDEAREYVFEKLGLQMVVNGIPNQDQIEFMENIDELTDDLVKWFFSGNWIEDWREI